jgi:hypothetical protein
MKTRKQLLLYVKTLFIVSCAQAQGFINLDFESANLPPILPGEFGGMVPITSALPGWTGYLGTNRVSGVLQNSFTLGNASIDIFGPYWPSAGIIDGKYSLVLQAGANPFSGIPGDSVRAYLSQTGLIPGFAQSIRLKASGFTFSVSLAGHDLSLIPLATGANYTLYGADVSQFAGQVGTLTLAALGPGSQFDSFDSIVFSPSPVPEPGALGLLAAGLSLVLLTSSIRRPASIRSMRGKTCG